MGQVRSAESVAHSLKRYLSIKSAYSPDFSPDDQRVAYLSDLTGVPQIWMTGTSAPRAPQQITLEDERIGFLSFATKSERIAFGIDRGGAERFQIQLLGDGGDTVVKLTDEPNVIHNWGDWSPDESAITYSSNARSQEYFDIYVQDLNDRSVEMVHRYDGNAYPVTWSPDGSKILFEVTHSPFDHDLFLLDLGDKSAEQLTPHSGDAAFYSPTFDASGRFVYCATDKDREFTAIARIDVGSHELEYLYAEDWDIEGLSATRDKETIAFTVNDGGASRLMVWDLSNEAPEEVPLPKGQVGGLDWSNDGKKLAFSLSSSSANSDVWMFDFAARGSPLGALSRLTFSSTCGIAPQSFVEPELVKFTVVR